MRRSEWLFLLAGVVVSAIFLVRGLAPDGSLVVRYLPSLVALRFSAAVKLLALLCGALSALVLSRRFPYESGIRTAWMTLGCGLGIYFVAQGCLAWYQFGPLGEAPYPSIADPLFLLAMALLISAFVTFVVSYHAAGLPVGAPWEVALFTGLTLVLLLPAGYLILLPALRAESDADVALLNVAYPLLDILLIVPSLFLLRMTFRLRGGSLWRVWSLMLGGVLLLTVGDILFAYFSTLEVQVLDPFLNLAYVLSYILIAWGIDSQRAILTQSGD